MIICGASAYSRDWDYKRIRKVADEIEALVLADISHPAGLIAAKLLNDPLEYCHIVTSTTHKTLRGPRGGVIMMRDNIKNPFGLKWKNGNLKSMGALLDAAVFPGIQRTFGACNWGKSCSTWRSHDLQLSRLHERSQVKCQAYVRTFNRQRIQSYFWRNGQPLHVD